jgi:hypothetical protein
MNTNLDRPFSKEEVERASFAMKPNKSPGVDGFTVDFFSKNIGIWLSIKCQKLCSVL